MIDKNTILSMTDRGLEVFRHYLPPFEVRKNFRNPFYDDRKPSCSVYYDKHNGVWRMHDFGDPTYSGDCFWLVGYLYGLDLRADFGEVLRRISGDLGLGLLDEDEELQVLTVVHSMTLSTGKGTETEAEHKPTPYSYNELEWDEVTLDYWSQYGIYAETLERYRVLPLGRFSSVSRKGKPYTIENKKVNPLYAYDLGTGLKLYRPYCRKLKFMYAGQVPHPYIFGFDQLPESGDLVLLTGGEKDVLSLAARGFCAVCLNSETASVPTLLLSDLCGRFGSIGILYDMDETGVRSSLALLEKYPMCNLHRITLPLTGTKKDKDVSDYVRAGVSAEELRRIINQSIAITT